MDAVMNVVHGPEACVAIRKMGFKGKIIAVTGNTLSEDVDHFLSCGANVLIGKPLQVSNLVKVLTGECNIMCNACQSRIFQIVLNLEY